MSTEFGLQLAAIARNLDHFGETGPNGHRLRRVRRFFAVLARLARLHPAGKLPAHQTHLVFLASVRQVAQQLHKADDEDGWYGAARRQRHRAAAALRRVVLGHVIAFQ